MSTAARKARKRERQFWHYNSTEFANECGRPETGPYLHTKKQGTPFLDRAVGPGADHKGNARPSKTQAKRNMRLHLAANPPAKIESLELDPKPYRVGRKRFASYTEAMANTRIAEGEVVMAPRKQYEQDHSKY